MLSGKTDRPADGKSVLLDEFYSGETAASKLERVRCKMDESGADVHLLSSLDDIAWLLNIRGNRYLNVCPLVLAYLIIYKDHVELFCR